jgi:hypothetical protein
MKGSTIMMIHNLTLGRAIDDNRDNAGNPRPTFDECVDYAHMINDALNLASIAVDARKELSSFVAWLGSKSRQHAIDNELCGNYERFLSIELGEKRDECVALDSIIRDDVETFVVEATRPHRINATVNVPVTVSRITRSDEVSGYDVASRLHRRGTGDSINYYDTTVITSETVPLEYHEAQEANENYHRRGDYGVSSVDNDY